ncbi:MAG: hypothetical protein ABIN91_23200 [Mucilaginibacter sp.]|uniref:hypothetical protein n=1 Tax=Mucilaginibacter sp. TaxID=1882438 RepID=UPI003265C9FE
MNHLKQLFFFVLFLQCLMTFAQAQPKLKDIVSAMDTLQSKLPVEKLFLHLDKPNYASGDTIWFKAYLLNGDYLTPSTRSGLLYIELDDLDNKCVKRIMAPVSSGLSWGNIALNPEDIPDGSYTLRAYTNWMRNFGEDYVFKKQLYITSLTNDPLLVGIRNKQVTSGPKDSIMTSLLFTGVNKHPVLLQDMQLNVLEGKRRLYRFKASTSFDGQISLSYALSAKMDTRKLMIQAQEINKKENARQWLLPVAINRPEKVDLQFMPEGGNLVAGLPTLIGFKAIGEDGRSVEIEGKIYNNKQQLITGLKSTHKGMGAFYLTPEIDESYSAMVDLPGGGRKSYPLPGVKSTGTHLQIRSKDADSLEVSITATNDLAKRGNSFYLLGQARNMVCYGALIVFNKGIIKKTIVRSLFPTGVARFTLLSTDKRPLNERMIYIDQHDQLQLYIRSDRTTYAPHDSIALKLQVTDRKGQPVRGFFSLAVTDDSQVKCDSNADNLMSNILLSSCLKGTIEDPNYYFDYPSPETAAALDNLLLTQGWVGYNWEQIYGPVKPSAFAAEPEFAIHGKVTNIFNKPVANSEIRLLSKKPHLLLNTLTGNDGRFTFRGFSPVDTASFFIQAFNKHGKSFNIGIEVDEFTPPVFAQTAILQRPWYLNTDTAMLQNLNSIQAKQAVRDKMDGLGRVLKQVNIVSKKIIKGSHNLNGPGEADQVLDEKAMEKAGKKTLGDLLEEKVAGYNVFGFWSLKPASPPMPMYYMIKDRKIVFLFDGMPLERYQRSMDDYYQYVKDYLDYYTAEDIKGIEVIASEHYTSSYSQYLDPRDFVSQWAFIEITTRSGAGPVLKKTPGIYVYKPLPFSMPKQFYRPRYTVKDKPNGTDVRSTIHWKPHIVTDTAGRATISFYSADKPARYTVIMQGTDLHGAMGYQRAITTVK